MLSFNGILLGGFLLIVRAISFAIHSRVHNKLSETVTEICNQIFPPTAHAQCGKCFCQAEEGA